MRGKYYLYLVYNIIMSQTVLDALEEVSEKEEEVEVEKEVEVEEEDDSIQAPKQKRPRTQAQKDAFDRCIQKRTQAREARVVKRGEVEVEEKKKRDEKIVQKAIKITNRKNLAEKILDDEDKEDAPIQRNKALVKPEIPPKLQIVFV